MKIPRKDILIFSVTVLLVIAIQIIRLGLVLSLNTLENKLAWVYQPSQAAVLTQSDIGTARKSSGLIIQDDQSAVVENLAVVLDNMQCTYKVAGYHDRAIEYDQYDFVIFVEKPDDQPDDLTEIIQYGEGGGKILFLGDTAAASLDNTEGLSSLLGIRDRSAAHPASSLFFHTEILSGIVGELSFKQDDKVLPSLFQPRQIQLAPACLVHVADDYGNPVIWERTNDWHVMAINTGNYGDKRLRGLLTGALSLLLGDIAYPVTGSKVVQVLDAAIDDRQNDDMLGRLYNRNYNQFIKDIWWPDMTVLMKKHHLKFSLAYLASLATTDQHPSEPNSQMSTSFSVLSAAVLRNGGEISFQGYDRRPLILRQDPGSGELSGWPDGASLAESVRKGASFIRASLPNYQVRAYSAAAQELGLEGLAALKSSFPNLMVVSGCLIDPGQTNNGTRDIIGREFSCNNGSVVFYPYLTEGGGSDADMRFEMASAITAYGMISHAFYADEILKGDQLSGHNWENTLGRYEEMLKYVGDHYDWLTPDTLSTAAERLKQTKNVDLFYSSDGRQITLLCGGFSDSAPLILVTSKTIQNAIGCDYQRIDSLRYLIKMKEKTATLEVVG